MNNQQTYKYIPSNKTKKANIFIRKIFRDGTASLFIQAPLFSDKIVENIKNESIKFIWMS